MSATTPPTMAGPGVPRKKRGCLFYGCLVLVIAALLLGAGVGVGLWYLNKQLTSLVMDYTDAAPLSLPRVEMSQADYDSLEKRVAAFGEALKAGRSADALELGGDEVNALLQRSAAFSAWKEKVHVMLEGDQVRGQVSLPLDSLAGVPMLKKLQGRYLNGSGVLRVGMSGGQLDVRLQSISVKGQALPAEFVQALGQENLAAPAYQDPQNADALSKLGRVEVKDGKLVLVPK